MNAPDGAAPAPPIQAAEPELQELLAALSLDGPREIAFEESRYNRLLVEPVRSSGRLIYEPPDRLTKRIEAPRRESAVLEQDRLAILDAEDRVVAGIDLWLQPEMQLVYGSMQAVLKGDSEALHAAFWVSLEREGEAWTLELSPKSPSPRLRLQQILIDGRDSQIRSFEFRRAEGNRSVIRLLPDQPQQ